MFKKIQVVHPHHFPIALLPKTVSFFPLPKSSMKCLFSLAKIVENKSVLSLNTIFFSHPEKGS